MSQKYAIDSADRTSKSFPVTLMAEMQPSHSRHDEREKQQQKYREQRKTQQVMREDVNQDAINVPRLQCSMLQGDLYQQDFDDRMFG